MEYAQAHYYGERLPLHFKTEDHHFPANDYITSIQSINTTLYELNRRLFKGNLDCELFIHPNEEGSFKGITSVIVKGAKKAGKGFLITSTALATLITIAEADSTKRFLRGLTDKEIHIEEYAEEFAEALRDVIKQIYITKNTDLEKKIDNNINLDKVIKAKSDFYKMCFKNPEIKAVGFEDDEFNVERRNFLEHISNDKIRPLDSLYRVYDAIIISPVDVDKKIRWELQDVVTKHIIKAFMGDEKFKESFLNGDFPLKETKDDDILKILVEYKRELKNGEIEISDILIETVFSFNDKEITPLDANLPEGTEFIIARKTPMDNIWGV